MSRNEQRINALRNKRDKLDMLERLIDAHTKQTKPDYKYLKKLHQRTNRLRVELAVISTVEPNDPDGL
jgi:hypothetical protein